MSPNHDFRSSRFAQHAFHRCVLASAVLLMVATTTYAAPVVLSEGNSSVTLDTQLQSGVSNWTIDGASHLSQLWFWYRVGPTGPEASIDSLVHNPIADLSTLDTNFEPGIDTMIARYTSPGLFELTLKVALTAGSTGSNNASLIEQVAVKNISGATLSFHLFQLAHFSLNGAIAPDTVEILGNNTAFQSDVQLSLITEVESVALPTPAHHQVGTSGSLLGALNNGSATTLTDAAGPFTNPNAAFAFQWSHNIPANGTLLVSSGQNVMVVPEPSALVLLSLGSVMAGAFVLRQKRKSAKV